MGDEQARNNFERRYDPPHRYERRNNGTSDDEVRRRCKTLYAGGQVVSGCFCFHCCVAIVTVCPSTVVFTIYFTIQLILRGSQWTAYGTPTVTRERRYHTVNDNVHASRTNEARAARRIALTVEFIIIYVLIPALPLAGLRPRWYVPAFLVAIVWIAVVGIRARRSRKTSRGGRVGRTKRSESGVRRRLPPDFAAISITFLAFAVVSAVMIALIRPDLLFSAPREAPRRWLLFWFIYTVGSVAPQEALFRVVFFDRYRVLWGDRRWLALLLNAVSFSIAHAILHHPIVYALTFAGGYVFSLHWLRSRRFLSLCLLHGVYGFWLFTVGLGPVFGFPF